jgi:RimJ/RimL family protein N-acetyltransferase
VTGRGGLLTLRDGARVRVRPLVPADRDWIMRGFAMLSEESRYNRFLAPVRTLSPRVLRRLVDTVDGDRHVALVMFEVPQTGPEAPIGVARFVRLAGEPECAEVAVTIVDRHQGKGAGTVLVDALVDRACRVGVACFSATMASGNLASERLLTRVGDVARREYVGNGVTEVVVTLRCALPLAG